VLSELKAVTVAETRHLVTFCLSVPCTSTLTYLLTYLLSAATRHSVARDTNELQSAAAAAQLVVNALPVTQPTDSVKALNDNNVANWG